jgi:hypothetical protein
LYSYTSHLKGMHIRIGTKWSLTTHLSHWNKHTLGLHWKTTVSSVELHERFHHQHTNTCTTGRWLERIGACYVYICTPFFILSGVGLSPLGTAATSGLLYRPQMIDEGDWGSIGGMKIGRGNRSTQRKPAPAPLCPSQLPHDQTRARTQAATVGSQRLTAWAMARPFTYTLQSFL